jgi:hypothetical protein
MIIKKMSLEMWKELNTKYKGLPTPVKSSFIKMWTAKIEQKAIKNKVDRY